MDQYDRLKRISQLRNSRVQSLRQRFAPTPSGTEITPSVPTTPPSTPSVTPTGSQTFLPAASGSTQRWSGLSTSGSIGYLAPPAPWPPAGMVAAAVNADVARATKEYYSTSGNAFETFIVSVGLLRYNTAALPDDILVTSAVLRIYMRSVQSAMFSTNANVKPGEDRSLTFDWTPWTLTANRSTYAEMDSAWDEDSGAWTATAGTNAHAGIPVKSLPYSGWVEIPLLNANANINKSGNTHLRGHISGDAPSKTESANYSVVDFYSASSPETAAQLVVNYA